MVAAGYKHTVLLQSDGKAAAFGDNWQGQCDIPALDADVTYTRVAAGPFYTVLLQSDGKAAAFGDNAKGQCDVPALGADVTYTLSSRSYILQAIVEDDVLTLFTLGGDKVCSITCLASDRLVDVQQRLSINMHCRNVHCEVALPTGTMLDAALLQNNQALLGDFVI